MEQTLCWPHTQATPPSLSPATITRLGRCCRTIWLTFKASPAYLGPSKNSQVFYAHQSASYSVSFIQVHVSAKIQFHFVEFQFYNNWNRKLVMYILVGSISIRILYKTNWKRLELQTIFMEIR